MRLCPAQSKLYGTLAWVGFISMFLISPAWAKQKVILFNENGTAEIEVGMKYSQVKALVRNFPCPRHEGDGCRQINLADRELMLLFIDGVLARIDFYGTHYVTDKNVRVGSSQQDVAAVYNAEAILETDTYDPTRLDVTVKTTEKLGLKFYITDRGITEISAGTISALALVEGCL